MSQPQALLATPSGKPRARGFDIPFIGEPGAEELDTLRFIPWGRINPFYQAVVYSVEEAVINALFANETMIGRDGHRSPGLPRDEIKELLEAHA